MFSKNEVRYGCSSTKAPKNVLKIIAISGIKQEENADG